MIGEGHGAVRLVDVSGNTAQFDTSGNININGSITATVSGQPVKVSGETVIVASGTVVLLSGVSSVRAVVYDSTANPIVGGAPNGDNAANSNRSMFTLAFNYAANNGSTFDRLRVTTSGANTLISGVQTKLVVAFSGDPITVSGNAVTVSGNVNYYFGPTIRTATTTVVTNASGGTQLSSGAVTSVMIKNRAANTSMWVNVSGQAVSGVGYEIEPGEAVPFPVNNFNVLWLAASTSGQYVSFYGVST